MLVNQQPSLLSHVLKKHEQAGKLLFENTNAWVALSEILTNILQDPNLQSTYLVVDALDKLLLWKLLRGKLLFYIYIYSPRPIYRIRIIKNIRELT